MAAGGGSSATVGGKKVIKKGKRKIKKRKSWQSSFSSQTVRAGGGSGITNGGATVLNAIGGLFGLGGTQATGRGRKLKIQRRPVATSWQTNRLATKKVNAKQTSATPPTKEATPQKKVASLRKPLLQKRWKSETQVAANPVGLKTVGIATPKIGQKSQVTQKQMRVGTGVTVVAKPVSSSKTATPQVRHLANTRFQAIAKTATSTSTKTVVPNKLNLGVKNPLAGNGKKYGAKIAKRLSLMSTRRPLAPVNPNRSTLSPLAGRK